MPIRKSVGGSSSVLELDSQSSAKKTTEELGSVGFFPLSSLDLATLSIPPNLDVTEVGDSQAALSAAKAIRPRVIIAGFDSRTRDDRLTFCPEIKADSRTKSIPILLTSADVTDDDVELATDQGVLVLTVMQLDSSKLVAAVKGVLTAGRAEPLRASLRRRKDVNRAT